MTHAEHLKVCRYECGARRAVCKICHTIMMPHDLKPNGACHYYKCQEKANAQEAAS